MDDKMTIENGISLRRAGDAHPQGRVDVKMFEYREGQPVSRFYGQAIEQLFTWASEKGIGLQELATQTPQLRQLVELSGGKVTAVQG